MSKKSGGTSFMGLSKKVVVLFAVASLPMMVMYQNCSKTQNFAMNDMTSAKLQGSSLDSGLLPSGVEVPVDLGSNETNKYQVEPEQNALGGVDSGPDISVAGSGAVGSTGTSDDSISAGSPGASGSSGNSGSTEVLADCSKYATESQNKNLDARYSNDSASGVQGFKVLSPDDFNGSRHLRSISNTGGHIILCNLEVDEYSDSNGRVDLVNSHATFKNFKGTIKYIKE